MRGAKCKGIFIGQKEAFSALDSVTAKPSLTDCSGQTAVGYSQHYLLLALDHENSALSKAIITVRKLTCITTWMVMQVVPGETSKFPTVG